MNFLHLDKVTQPTLLLLRQQYTNLFDYLIVFDFNIEFSKNNGWTCDYIIRAGINDNDCYFPEIDNIHYKNIESFASKFKSYDDCINYNKNIYNLIKQRNNIKDAGYTKAIDFIDNFNKNNQ